MSPIDFRKLLAETGALAALHAVIELQQGPSWVVAVDDQTIVSLEWRDLERRIVLSCDVGVLPEPATVGSLTPLLRYNAAWRETGGLRLGLAGDGVVQLLLDLPRHELDPHWLARVLHNVADVAAAWGAALAGQADVPDAAPADGDPLPNALRV